MITRVAPSGTPAPVNTRTAFPGPTVPRHQAPARDSPITSSHSPGSVAASTTAYPSIVEAAERGAWPRAIRSAASVRPAASASGTVSQPSGATSPISASAASKEIGAAKAVSSGGRAVEPAGDGHAKRDQRRDQHDRQRHLGDHLADQEVTD